MNRASGIDLFVIGGGPAGLAAALAARRKGMRVAVADCARPPVDKACGEGLMPDARAALAAVGVSTDAADSFPFRGIRFVNGADCVDASFPNGQALGMRRTELHRVLVEHAEQAGVTLFWDTRVDGITGTGVCIGGTEIPCRWIAGADGGSSIVRRWAGLDRYVRNRCRYGFRRHYQLAPWTDCMEIHWGNRCQIYVTPVRKDEVCVVVVSRNQYLRLDEALADFPQLGSRLSKGAVTSSERGAVSAWRTLPSVYSGRVALVGDASGSVDAVTGEGLCCAFRQATALADAIVCGDMQRYQAEHRRISMRPGFMSAMLLTLEQRAWLRRWTVRTLASHPHLFARMLAVHVGAESRFEFALNRLSLGWQFLTT